MQNILRLNVVSFDELLDNPSILIGFLVGFIFLLVPTSKQIYLLIVAEYANESGHGFIGNTILFVLGLLSDFTTWLVLTFIEPVTYFILIAFVFFSVVSSFVQLFKFK